MNDINMPILEEGDTGKEVEILQEKLWNLGFYAGNTTGSFGSTTEGSVIDFQSENALPPTGVVDSNTWEVLLYQTQSQFPLTSATLPTLRQGDSGPYVERLQTSLRQVLAYSGPITGNFDQATFNAVRNFQIINRLTATGVVDLNTWSALEYLYAPLSNCEGIGPPPEEEFYTVVAGDTLWAIANRFGLTVDELKSLNNLTSNNLSIGQRLRIRAGATTPPPTGEYDTYIVRSGDTLWALASRFNTTVAELRRINNLTSDNLSIGQQLLVPRAMTPKPPIEEEYIIHTVVKGDTLFALASRYGVTVDDIKRASNITSNSLSIGQTLRIPVRTTALFHTVVKGDTLWSIATRYNTTVDEIRRLNSLTTNTLSIGQILRIRG